MCLGGIWIEGGFTLALVSGVGGGSDIQFEQVQL